MQVAAWQVGHPNLKISRYAVIPSALTFGILGVEMRGGNEPKIRVRLTVRE